MSPSSISFIPLPYGPAEVAGRLRHLGGLVFFDSAREEAGGGSVSIVAAGPAAVLRGRSAADWEQLRSELARRRLETADDGLPHGFAAGWIAYDGSFCFGIYDRLLIFQHGPGIWMGIGGLEAELAEKQPPVVVGEGPRFVGGLSRETFCGMVRRAKEYIAAGDIYQVNLSQQFSAAWDGDALEFYQALRHCSPAPHAAFMELGGRAILSSSPECFLRMSGNHILTRPIKGTRPRRPDPQADERSAFDLLTSEKETAELVMITDLERNDLGQVCEYGSVRVAELLKLERHEQVFHLVSTVDGRLRDHVDHAGALRACFPGGSITGAPKKRAMEIIAELEPLPRGIYTGALGWLGFNRESQFNIAIRTVVMEGGCAHFHVGAGIVADSEPEAEYEETLHKAAGILAAAEFMGSARQSTSAGTVQPEADKDFLTGC